jgi:hypothetical protein
MLNTGLQPRTERSEAPRGCNSTRKASNRTEFSINSNLPRNPTGSASAVVGVQQDIMIVAAGQTHTL